MRNLALFGLLGLSACGGISPGDYIIFRVAQTPEPLGAECFGGTIPEDLADDTTTFALGQSFALFRGTGNAYYLDFGTNVINGTKSGGSYTFTGDDVDVTYNGDTRYAEGSSIVLDLDISGKYVSGMATIDTYASCSGEACGPQDNFSCTAVSTFSGSQIDDVEFGYNLPQAEL